VCRHWGGFVDDFFVLIDDGRSRATNPRIIIGPIIIVIESNAEKSGVRANADNQPPTRGIFETRATTIDGTEASATRKKRAPETRGD
jgi:hypothetical protein